MYHQFDDWLSNGSSQLMSFLVLETQQDFKRQHLNCNLDCIFITYVCMAGEQQAFVCGHSAEEI